MSERVGRGNEEGRNQQGELVIHIHDYNGRDIFVARGSVQVEIDPSHRAPHGQHPNEEPHHIDIQTVNAATEQVPTEGEHVNEGPQADRIETVNAATEQVPTEGEHVNEGPPADHIEIVNAGTEQVPTEGEHVNEGPPADHIETVDAGTEQVPKDIRSKLYQAAFNGHWSTALEIYNKYPKAIDSEITTDKETALHIAVLAEQTHFVKRLAKKMSKEGLAHQNKFGDTALGYAAVTGKREIAEAMLKEREDLAKIGNDDGMLPFYLAVCYGHIDMARYLHRKTKKEWITDKDCKDLFVSLINTDLYDIALNMIKENKHLAVAEDQCGETALHVLARKPHMLSYTQQWRKCFNLFPGSNNVGDQNMMRRKARELIELAWEQTISKEDGITDLDGNNWGPIFVAVEQGNVEFLRILIRSYPDLVVKINEEGQTIFHAAVVNRQEEIFKLIHETRFKNAIVKVCGNDMLNLAVELAPSDRLNRIPGPAFQLQRELLWFEEVKKVVGPQLVKQKNNNHDAKKPPRELFIEKHEDLINSGEKWVKKTANYCMIVATLVATVVFAAAFTVPGGNDQNTGFPIFLHKLPFKIFAIADAISLIFSISSVIIFLSLLTSTYAVEDFLWSLPNKLVIGLACLLVSLLAMMVAFMTTFFVYFTKLQLLAYVVPGTSAACIPVGLFIWSNGRLILKVFRSTYSSKKLFRPGN